MLQALVREERQGLNAPKAIMATKWISPQNKSVGTDITEL